MFNAIGGPAFYRFLPAGPEPQQLFTAPVTIADSTFKLAAQRPHIFWEASLTRHSLFTNQLSAMRLIRPSVEEINIDKEDEEDPQYEPVPQPLPGIGEPVPLYNEAPQYDKNRNPSRRPHTGDDQSGEERIRGIWKVSFELPDDNVVGEDIIYTIS